MVDRRTAEHPMVDRRMVEHPTADRPTAEHPTVDRRMVEHPTADRPTAARVRAVAQARPAAGWGDFRRIPTASARHPPTASRVTGRACTASRARRFVSVSAREATTRPGIASMGVDSEAGAWAGSETAGARRPAAAAVLRRAAAASEISADGCELADRARQLENGMNTLR